MKQEFSAKTKSHLRIKLNLDTMCIHVSITKKHANKYNKQAIKLRRLNTDWASLVKKLIL